MMHKVHQEKNVEVSHCFLEPPGDLCDSDSDSDPVTGSNSELSSDSETEPNQAAELHNGHLPGGPVSVQASTRSDYMEEDLSLGVCTEAKTEGDLHIHSVLQCRCDAITCQFSIDGTLLAIGLSNGTIKIYSMERGEMIQTLQDNNSVLTALPVTALRFTVSAQSSCLLLATYACGSVRCWHLWSGECLWWTKELTENEINEGKFRQTLCLSISPSRDHAVTCGSDSAIHLYDLNTRQKIKTLTASPLRTVMDGHRLRVFAVTFHPEGETQFISGGWDNTVQFWDTREKNAVRMVYGPHLCGDALQIDPACNQIITGSWRKYAALEFWDYGSAKKVKEVPKDPCGDSKVYTCHYLGQDHITAAGSSFNMLRVIHRHSLTTESRLWGLSSPVFSSSICPSGEWTGLLAVTTGDRVFLLDRGQHLNKRLNTKYSQVL